MSDSFNDFRPIQKEILEVIHKSIPFSKSCIMEVYLRLASIDGTISFLEHCVKNGLDPIYLLESIKSNI